jgi:hypothetical protein
MPVLLRTATTEHLRTGMETDARFAPTSTRARGAMNRGLTRVVTSTGVRTQTSSRVSLRMRGAVPAQICPGTHEPASSGVPVVIRLGNGVVISRTPTSSRTRVPVSSVTRGPASHATLAQVRYVILAPIRLVRPDPISSVILAPIRFARRDLITAPRPDPTSLAASSGISARTTAKTCSRPIGTTSYATSSRRLAGRAHQKTIVRDRARSIRSRAKHHR